jgi:hypothetical protein
MPDSSGTNSRSPDATGAPTGLAEISTVHRISDGKDCDALAYSVKATMHPIVTHEEVVRSRGTLYNTF